VWPIEERSVPQTDAKWRMDVSDATLSDQAARFRTFKGVNPENIMTYSCAETTALQLLEGYKIGPIFTPPPAATDRWIGRACPGCLATMAARTGNRVLRIPNGICVCGSATNPRVVLLTPNATPTPTPGVNGACCDLIT